MTPRSVHVLAQQAEIESTSGRLDEAVSTLSNALELGRRRGDRCWEAELHRLQGETVLQGCESPNPDPGALKEVETCYRRALATAREQSAKSLELRGATSLAELLGQQTRFDEAREILEPVYGWFVEGLATRDLKRAETLLQELR